jgi:hypothetical protein
MKRVVVLAVLVCLAGGVVASPASAAKGASPKQICADLAVQDPEAYAFLNTKPGACVSSVASVGVEALMAGAFPSTAAAVGNCKMLEQTAFLDPAEPNPGGPYPYQFYWFAGSDPDLFTAKNRAGCLSLLEQFHTGELAPPAFP